MVVYQLQALQARRKLLREEAEAMRDAAHELHQLAVDFHTEEYSKSKQLELLRAITDLDRRRELLPKIARAKRVSGFMVEAVAGGPAAVTIPAHLVVAINQAATLEHFGDPAAAPLEHSSPQVQRIGQRCNELVAAVDGVLLAAMD